MSHEPLGDVVSPASRQPESREQMHAVDANFVGLFPEISLKNFTVLKKKLTKNFTVLRKELIYL